MIKNRIFTVAAAFAFAGLVGCDSGADQEFEATDQEIFTQPGTETIEVEVPTEDSLLVERNVETTVDVDTTEIGSSINETEITTPAPPQ